MCKVKCCAAGLECRLKKMYSIVHMYARLRKKDKKVAFLVLLILLGVGAFLTCYTYEGTRERWLGFTDEPDSTSTSTSTTSNSNSNSNVVSLIDNPDIIELLSNSNSNSNVVKNDFMLV